MERPVRNEDQVPDPGETFPTGGADEGVVKLAARGNDVRVRNFSRRQQPDVVARQTDGPLALRRSEPADRKVPVGDEEDIDVLLADEVFDDPRLPVEELPADLREAAGLARDHPGIAGICGPDLLGEELIIVFRLPQLFLKTRPVGRAERAVVQFGREMRYLPGDLLQLVHGLPGQGARIDPGFLKVVQERAGLGLLGVVEAFLEGPGRGVPFGVFEKKIDQRLVDGDLALEKARAVFPEQKLDPQVLDDPDGLFIILDRRGDLFPRRVEGPQAGVSLPDRVGLSGLAAHFLRQPVRLLRPAPRARLAVKVAQPVIVLRLDDLLPGQARGAQAPGKELPGVRKVPELEIGEADIVQAPGFLPAVADLPDVRQRLLEIGHGPGVILELDVNEADRVQALFPAPLADVPAGDAEGVLVEFQGPLVIAQREIDVADRRQMERLAGLERDPAADPQGLVGTGHGLGIVALVLVQEGQPIETNVLASQGRRAPVIVEGLGEVILGLGEIAPLQEEHPHRPEAEDLQPAADPLPGHGQGPPAVLVGLGVLAQVHPDEGAPFQALDLQHRVSDLAGDPERRLGLSSGRRDNR